MDPALPLRIELELSELGVLPTDKLTDIDIFEEPVIPRVFEFQMPELDEDGQPPF